MRESKQRIELGSTVSVDERQDGGSRRGESAPLVGFMQRHSNIPLRQRKDYPDTPPISGPRLLQNEENSSVISSPSTGARSVQRVIHAAHLITPAQS
jgi:hypothetical protein